MQKKQIDSVFQTQNIQIRKCIRDIDMGYDNAHSFAHILENSTKPDINILVVGPPKSGKSSLLRSMHYSLNSHLSCNVEDRTVGNTCFEKYEIKRNKRSNIQGLAKIKQTDQKLGIFGYEVDFNIMGKQFCSPLNRYAKILELINTKSLNCGGYSSSFKFALSGINFVIICLSMVDKCSQEEILAQRTFIAELEEKRIKFIIVGTKLDQIIGRESRTVNNSGFSVNSLEEQDKLQYIQQWKISVLSQISSKINAQTYCLQNYLNILPKSKGKQFKNSQRISFYALNLLNICVKRAPESQKIKKKKLSKFLLCF